MYWRHFDIWEETKLIIRPCVFDFTTSDFFIVLLAPILEKKNDLIQFWVIWLQLFGNLWCSFWDESVNSWVILYHTDKLEIGNNFWIRFKQDVDLADVFWHSFIQWVFESCFSYTNSSTGWCHLVQITVVIWILISCFSYNIQFQQADATWHSFVQWWSEFYTADCNFLGQILAR